MARFRALIQGTRGEASRLGHQGIRASVNGWHCGVKVCGGIEDGADVFYVYATSGSNPSRQDVPVAVVREGVAPVNPGKALALLPKLADVLEEVLDEHADCKGCESCDKALALLAEAREALKG